MKLRPPQLIVDVVRDLRDRRLLIPAAALLVALVAVPMLLSRSASPAAPPLAESGGAGLEAAATEPAVLVENVSVRDYEKRLDELKQKNPFAEHFKLPPTDGGGLAGMGLGAEPTGPGPGATATSAGSTDPGGGGQPAATPDSPASTSPPPKPPEAEALYLAWRIDVVTGPVGSTVERNGVKQLSLLPSNNKPVAVFLGVAESGEEAVFTISNEATVVDTTGRCEPSPNTCRYLVMARGEGASIDYAPDGVKYRLALRKISRVEIDKPGKVAGRF